MARAIHPFSFVPFSKHQKRLAENFYRHDLTTLRKAAGLEDEMDRDAAMRLIWETVRDWSEQGRYQIGKTEQDARLLYDAIEKEVVPWIKSRW